MPKDLLQPSVISRDLIRAAKQLCLEVDALKFSPPVTHVYNPLGYAWAPHRLYLQRFGRTKKRVLFLGMNPGPFGMVQTGVPFGEILAVRNWLAIEAPIRRPPLEHPRRPITGFACTRSEISGQRLWRLFAERFGHADEFFASHIVMNYCPLAFLESTGRNRTPDKLAPAERNGLIAACDRHLKRVVAILEPEWVVGIGDFATRRAVQALPDGMVKIGRILHPSPASPSANRGWAGAAIRQLQALKVWD